MESEVGSRSARAISTFLILVMVMSAIPILGVEIDSIENAAAEDGEDYVRVGWMIDMTNWNPLTIQNTADWTSTLAVYSTLFMYDQSYGSIVGSLAADYYQIVWPSGNMSTFINITEAAYFRNGENPLDTSHPLTAFDIEYTLELIMSTTGNMWEYYLYNVTGVNVTDDAVAWDYGRTDKPYQVRIDTEFTKSTLIDDLTWIPMVPKYVWELTSEQQLLGNMDPGDLIGCGPFYFNDMDKGQWYEFNTAPNYHGTADYGDQRSIDFDGVRYTIYTDPTALAIAMNQGTEDAIDITGAQSQVWDYVGGSEATVNVIKQVTNELGAIDIAINAVPEEFRTTNYAEGGNKILLDDVVRKAIGMTLNRDDVINNYLDGLPTAADTMINPGFWHATPPDLLPYNTAWARQNLTNAGYEDLDDDGYLEVTVDSKAYIEGWADEGDKLEFRLHVPDSDPTFATVGSTWVTWAKEAGIKFDFEVYSSGYMTSTEWYKLDYDLWVWSWYWTPEPLATLMCWRTDQMVQGGYNCVGPIGDWWWVDEENKIARSEYDDLFDQALRTVDLEERRDLVFQMQIMLYDSWTEFPPFYPIGQYAMTDEKFEGWGEWKTNLGRTLISCMPWLWFDLEVVVNRAPTFDEPPESEYTAYTTTDKALSVTVHDYEGDDLYVNFTFGDGSAPYSEHLTGDTTQPTVVDTTHRYEEPGTYTLNVSVTDMFEGRYIYREAIVVVLGEYNYPAEISGFGPDNPSPSYVDEVITWTATAIDPDSGTEGTDLKFTWNWGDGTYTVDIIPSVPDDTPVTSTKTHTWNIPSTYVVTVSVFDYGGTIEVGEHNASISMGYTIVVNQPPGTPDIQPIEGPANVALSCVATSIDADLDTLRFTWDWGDGTYDIQELTPTAPGQAVFSSIRHTWTTDGTYPVTVSVEDTDDHNVSAEILAVISDENVAPSGIVLTLSPDPVYFNVETVFNISASDANGDDITFTVDFGDESPEEVAAGDGGTTNEQFVEFIHTYEEDGTYTLTINVSDGSLSLEKEFAIVVIGNAAPELLIQDSFSAKYGVPKTIRPTSVTDADDDPLSVWYDWGDESAMTIGDPDDGYAGIHTYLSVGEFQMIVYVDDGNPDHNLSRTVNITVSELNNKAYVENIVPTPAKDEYSVGETITFVVTVNDLEGDNVTVAIEFGDGESDESTIDLEIGSDTPVTFTHEYDTDGIFVVNATVDDGQSHSDATLDMQTIDIVIVKEAGISIALIAGICILIIVVVAVILTMRKRKGATPSERGMGSMEGMSSADVGESNPPSVGPPGQ